ncbi:MAG TPA: hypothetical protein VFB88_08565 [Xanthobacteraceae bacterium]|nr:hypothetical protein [Xanthobacteraceae bacterium]
MIDPMIDPKIDPKIDPWAKASECERAADVTTDPERWAVLTELRDLWISFANETSFMSDADRTKEIAAIDVLHAATLASPARQPDPC